MRDSGARQAFGSVEAPVIVVAASSQMRDVCSALNLTCSRDERPVRMLIEGPIGSGKSVLAAAAHAQWLASGGAEDLLILGPETTPATCGSIARGEHRLVIADDFGTLRPDFLDALVAGRRHATRWVLSSGQGFDPRIRYSEDVSQVRFTLPAIELRPEDAVELAGLQFERASGGTLLGSRLAPEADEAIRKGPWPRGGHSIADAMWRLADMLILGGSLVDGVLLQPVAREDVDLAILDTLREHWALPAVVDPVILLVVEGESDVRLVRLAAGLAQQAKGVDLLEGLDVQAAGEGTQGGAPVLVERLLMAGLQGQRAVGILDNDEVGRREHKRAKQKSLRTYVLPREFDRLGSYEEEVEVEVEDLLPQETLADFYRERPDLEPYKTITRKGATRVVVAGNDKHALCDWIEPRATYRVLERLVFVIAAVRQHIGLPPGLAPSDEWLRQLSLANDHVDGG